MKRALAYARSLGVNYVWGLICFTVGVGLGGIWVAIALIATNTIWALL